MSTTNFDRRLNEWFDAVEPNEIPTRLLPTVFGQVAQTGQVRGPLHRFAAALEQAWTPRSVVLKSVALVALTALLLAALLAAALAAGFRPPIEPGIVDGLIAVEDAHNALADGSFAQQQIRLVDPETGNDAFITPSSVPACGASFSPDGSRYALLYQDPADIGTGVVNIGVANTVGEFKPTLLFRKPAQSYFDPAWAPDGSELVTTMEVAGTGAYRELWIVPADGTPARRLTDVQTSYAADWSPSGEWIAFVGVGPVHALYAVRPDGTDLQMLSPSGANSVAWSPLRDELAYTASDAKLRVVALDGHELFDMEDGVSSNNSVVGDLVPIWSPDATKIALVTNGQLYVFDIATRSVSHINTPSPVTHAVWSSDGGSMAVVTQPLGLSPADLFEVHLDGSQPRLIAQQVRARCMSISMALSWQEITR